MNNIVSTENSTNRPLNSGENFIGAWQAILKYNSLTMTGKSNQECDIYLDFSQDGNTVLYSSQINNPGQLEYHKIEPVRATLFRIRIINVLVSQSYLIFQTILSENNKIPYLKTTNDVLDVNIAGADNFEVSDSITHEKLDTIDETVKIINSMTDIQDGYSSIILEQGAAVYADSVPVPIKDVNQREGWYYTNTNPGNKMNYYFLNGLQETFTLNDLTYLYAKVVIDNFSGSVQNLPFLTAYTKPTGSGDAGAFYHSKITYALTNNTQKIGIGEEVYFFGKSVPVETERWFKNRIITHDDVITVGEALPTEQILFLSIGTDSAATALSVRLLVQELGFSSSNVKRKLKLIGYDVLEEIKNKPVDISGQTVDISGQSIIVSSMPAVDISGQTVDITGQSIVVSSMPAVDISGQTVDISGQTVDITGQSIVVSSMPAVDISGQTVDITGQSVVVSSMPAVDISGQTVDISGQTVDITGQSVVVSSLPTISVDISGQTVDISGQTVDITGQSVVVSSLPTISVDISGQTVDISGQTVDITGQSVVVSSMPDITVDISGQTVDISGQTVDISGQTVDISGQSVVVNTISGFALETGGNLDSISSGVGSVYGELMTVNTHLTTTNSNTDNLNNMVFGGSNQSLPPTSTLQNVLVYGFHEGHGGGTDDLHPLSVNENGHLSVNLTSIEANENINCNITNASLAVTTSKVYSSPLTIFDTAGNQSSYTATSVDYEGDVVSLDGYDKFLILFKLTSVNSNPGTFQILVSYDGTNYFGLQTTSYDTAGGNLITYPHYRMNGLFDNAQIVLGKGWGSGYNGDNTTPFDNFGFKYLKVRMNISGTSSNITNPFFQIIRMST